MSQGQLGRHLGLTFSQVQKYEKGANRIGAGRLYLLASVLSVPVHYFFEGVPDSRAETVTPGRTEDLATLDDAFLSIDDPETRQSVLALVCSLSAAKQAGRARRRAS